MPIRWCTVVQCSRCIRSTLAHDDEGGELPPGWHETSDLPDVGINNIAMCPRCYNKYLRAKRIVRKIMTSKKR